MLYNRGMFDILVVEDDFAVRKLTSVVLKRAQFNPVPCATAAEALARVKISRPALCLVDVMLPDEDGFSLVRELRGIAPDLPMIMVTAKGLPSDKRDGFNAGADDYMVKPVDEEELVLRIRALLRRSTSAYEQRITVGNVELDYAEKRARVDGEDVDLTQKEFVLLFTLLSQTGKIFTRNQLAEAVWGEKLSDDRTLNVHVNRIREKIGDKANIEIKAVRGLGYKAVKNEA